MIARGIASVILLMISIQLATADIDAMTLAMQQPYLNKNPLHWDNRNSASLWTHGVEPQYNSTWEMYTIQLKPGQSSSYKLAAYQTLRLYQQQATIKKTDFKVSLSNGTGLLKPYTLQDPVANHSLLISPSSSQTEIVTIKHAGQTIETIEIAIFFSRRDPIKQLAPYRDLAWLSGTWTGLSNKPFQLPEIYWKLLAHQPQSVEIEGPVRIAIKNRLHYEKQASAFIQNYRISYQLNNNPAQWLDFSTSVESRNQIFINTMKKVLGREQMAYLEIPAGQHRLQLMSDRNLFLQVLKQNRDDYLLPQLNEPPLSINKVYQQNLLAQQPLAITHALVQDAIYDNYPKSSALAASMLLKQAALKRKDYAKGLAIAKQTLGQNSFYRDLLPSIKQSRLAQFNAYFQTNALKKLENQLPDPELFKQHQQAALNRLGSATFTPILSSSKADSYFLQPLKSSTLLRIISDKRDCTPRQFKLQFNQQTAKTFNIKCLPEIVSDNAFISSLTDLALEKKQNSAPSYFYSPDHQGDAVIPVAINEVILPAGVKQIKLWADDEKNQPLNLALQIRAPRPFKLSEQSYLARLHDIPQQALFQLFITEPSQTGHHNKSPQQQLQNQWLPLKRYLTSLHRLYKNSVSRPVTESVKTETNKIKLAKTLALQAEKNQQWTSAIRHWSNISIATKGKEHDQALLAQAKNLLQLSENYLAHSLLRYLTLYAHDSVALQARKKLLDDYQANNDNQAILRLNAALFIEYPRQTHLKSLIQSLMQNKKYREVLLLSDLVEQQPVEIMVKAAYQLRWWQTFQQLLAQLPESQQAYWLGMKAAFQGHYQAAINIWNQPELNLWKKHLQTGLNLKHKLLKKTEQVLQQHDADKILYQQWQDWNSTQPGDVSWHKAEQYIKDAAGIDRYYSIERDLHSQMYRADSDRPVKLALLGPAKLNFKIRVLHQKAKSRLNGWLTIKDNQAKYRYPYFNNKAVEGLRLTGNGTWLPGNWVTLEYQVGKGFHEIELSSKQAPLSLTIDQLQADFPLSVLPVIKPESYMYMASNRLISEQQLKHSIAVSPSSSLAIADNNITLKKLLQPQPIKNQQQAVEKMMQVLFLMEKQKSIALIVFADKIQAQFPENDLIKQLWDRISKYSEWKKVGLIKSSAGMRFIKMQRGANSSPTLAIRKALIAQSMPGEHFIFGNKRLLLMMNNFSKKNLNAEIKLEDVNFLPESPVQLNYQINQGATKSIDLSKQSNWKKLKLLIPAGHHQIRFWIHTPVSNQFVKIRFPGQNLEENIVDERAFFVSTTMNPLKFYVKGPSKIRIDDWSNGKIVSRYQYVKADWQQLALPPFKGKQQRLLQIKQLNAIEQPSPVLPRYIQRNLIKVTEPTLELAPVSTDQVKTITDYYSLKNQSCCTWSVGTQIQRRNNLQEDTSRGTPTLFQQFNLEHRYYDQFNKNYWHTHVFSRIRDNGNPSFGIKESLSLLPSNKFPFTVNLEAKAVTQDIDGDQEWLGQFNFDIMQKALLTPKTTLTQRLAWFGRHMSLRDSDKVNKDAGFIDETITQDVDQDIYTAYKAQHTMGLTGSILLTHAPWLDTRWKLRLDSVSNENLNLLKPDHYSMQAHWRQLFGKLSVDASYRIRFYLEDQDRTITSTRQTARFRFNWQNWIYKRNRLEIGGQYNYDIDKNAHLGMIKFTYHFGDERGYRDFKPSAIDFRNIRERQWLDELH